MVFWPASNGLTLPFFCFFRGGSTLVAAIERFFVWLGRFSWSLSLTKENEMDCWLDSFTHSLFNALTSISAKGCRWLALDEAIFSSESVQDWSMEFNSELDSSIVERSRQRCDFLNRRNATKDCRVGCLPSSVAFVRFLLPNEDRLHWNLRRFLFDGLLGHWINDDW